MRPHDLVGAVLGLGHGRRQTVGQPLGGPRRPRALLHVAQRVHQAGVEPVLHLHERLGGAQEAAVGAHQPLLEGRRPVEAGDRGDRPRRVVAPARQVERPRRHDLEALGHLGRIAAPGQEAADGRGQVAQGGRVHQRLDLLPEQARRRRLPDAPGVALGGEPVVQAQERGTLEGAEVAAAAVRRLDRPHADRGAPRDGGGRVPGGLQALDQAPEGGLVGGGRHAASMRARASASAPSAIAWRSSTMPGSAHRPRPRVSASDTTPTRSAWRCPISASE